MQQPRPFHWGPILLASAALCLHASADTEGPTREVSVHARVDHWEWTETVDGQRLLKESGPLLNIGINGSIPIRRAFLLDIGGAVFVGSADYDGQSNGPGNDPVNTTTDYLGTEAWLHGKWRATPNADIQALPFVGIGARAWTRDIKDADALNLGYEEDWRTLFASAGLRGEGALNDEWAWFAEGAYRYALWNEVEYKGLLFTQGKDLTVEPALEGSWHAETGISHGRFTLTVVYEEWHFGRSNKVDAGDGWQVWQPNSDATVLGVTVSVAL